MEGSPSRMENPPFLECLDRERRENPIAGSERTPRSNSDPTAFLRNFRKVIGFRIRKGKFHEYIGVAGEASQLDSRMKLASFCHQIFRSVPTADGRYFAGGARARCRA